MEKSVLLSAVSSAALLFAAGAWADGGPVPEETPPPPPVYDEPAPVDEPAPAPAPEYNWYTTIFAGVAFGNDVEVGLIFDEGTESFELPLETGYLLGWTLGYDSLFGAGGFDLRPEVELSFRQQDLDLDEFGEGPPPDNISMPLDLLTLMGNLWIDFEMNGVTPYVGGGIGWGWADLPLFFLPFHIETSDFVWQFGGGLNFDVNERVFLGVGYRYLGANFEEDVDFIGSATIDYEYRTHEVLANLGVRF